MGKKFHIEFLNVQQKLSWTAFQQHDILFLSGVAGTGKTILAMAFAINEILQKQRSKIILSRPIVEAGEKLGYLPGGFNEKVDPYMYPLYDAMDKMLGREGGQREMVEKSLEIAPIAYLRGRTFVDAVCILDEAQNCTKNQLLLFLTRLGENSKIIITGDPTQTDIKDSGFSFIKEKLQTVPGMSIIEFGKSEVVRHPLVKEIINKLGE